MTIHHTIVKKAERNGLQVAEVRADVYSVTGDKIQFEGDDVSALVAGAVAAKIAMAQGLRFRQNGVGYVATKGSKTVATGADLEQVVADAVDALTPAKPKAKVEADDEDMEEDDLAEVEDDDDFRPSSVVPERYKQEYRAAGHPDNCGDWLAETLEAVTHVNGEFSLMEMGRVAQLNGVDTDKYLTNRNRGWQGRARMSMRNALVKKVVAAGALKTPKATIKAPAEWIELHSAKKVVGQKKGGK